MGAAVGMAVFTMVEEKGGFVHRRQSLWSILHTKITFLTQEAWDMPCWKLGGYSWYVCLYDYPATKLFLWHLLLATVTDSTLILCKAVSQVHPKLTHAWSLKSAVGNLVWAENRCLKHALHRRGQEPVERTRILDIRTSKADLGRGLHIRLWCIQTLLLKHSEISVWSGTIKKLENFAAKCSLLSQHSSW